MMTLNIRKSLLVIFVLGSVFAGLWFVAIALKGYKGVPQALEAISGVTVVETGGAYGSPFESVWAVIEVQGAGQIKLLSLNEASFVRTQSVIFSQIGPFRVFVEGEGYVGVKDVSGQPVRSRFYSGGVDIGAQGALRHLFPFEIHNVQDLVDHYDGIVAILAKWPVSPARRHYRDKNGTDYYYYTNTDGSTSKHITFE
jgi:hypothetical protein